MKRIIASIRVIVIIRDARFNKSPFYDLQNEIIKLDVHPNIKVHKKIVEAIKNSNPKNSLLNFTKKVCK